MVNYPMDWEMITLGEIIKEGFGNLVKPSFKIKKYDYKHFGSTPIISQEKEFISGYCNLSDINILSDQYICFGDHTEIFKYIDFSFIQGADGLKILKFNEEKIITKYAYYSLLFFYQRQNNYGRHFNHLLETQIAFPSLPEQRLIAETLSQFDTYISDLDELIVKKRNIRDGALEDLVTGKTRLNGFNGKWINTTLGGCVDILQGGTPKTTNPLYWNGNIVWVTPSEITKLSRMFISTSERKITKLGLDNSSATMLPAGTIVLCTRATIGNLAIASKPLATNQGFKNLICKRNTSNFFLYYYLKSIKEELILKAIGTTFLEISKKALSKINVFLPPLPEQRAIADVLMSMDNEIESLEMERDKMIQIREGAMDELLTGRVRLTK